MIKAKDGFGEYFIPSDNIKISYQEIEDKRNKNREVIDLSKKHKGITHNQIDYNMCLLRFGVGVSGNK